LYTDKNIPTPEQLDSLKSLLGFFSSYNYNLALLRSKADQYEHKLGQYVYGNPGLKSWLDHMKKEYGEDQLIEI
jgi:hypothetical protein